MLRLNVFLSAAPSFIHVSYYAALSNILMLPHPSPTSPGAWLCLTSKNILALPLVRQGQGKNGLFSTGCIPNGMHGASSYSPAHRCGQVTGPHLNRALCHPGPGAGHVAQRRPVRLFDLGYLDAGRGSRDCGFGVDYGKGLCEDKPPKNREVESRGDGEGEGQRERA